MEKGYEFLVDSREKTNMKMLVKLKKFEHRVTALPAGDFALKKFDCSPNRDIVGIERKAVNDLVQSIQSQRIFSQVKRMKMLYEIPFLFISGDVDEYTTKMMDMGLNVNTNVIYGTIASFICRGGVRVEWFPDDGSLVEVAYRLCEKVSEGKWELDSKDTPKRELTAIELLAEISGVTTSSAKALLSRFGSIQGVANATSLELESLPGIGPQTSNTIHRILTTRGEHETTGPNA